MVSVELILAAQNGDREALITILRSVERDAYNTAYYMLGNQQDAMDMTQEALLRIFRNIKQYETKALFKTWVHRIVTNLCIDCLRKRKETVPFDHAEPFATADERVEHQVLLRLTIEEVSAAIHKLSEPYRSIVVLRYVNQFSYDEIAETTQLPLNTVKSHLFRAKTKLQQLLVDVQKGGGHE